jgi:hypothetical protein
MKMKMMMMILIYGAILAFNQTRFSKFNITREKRRKNAVFIIVIADEEMKNEFNDYACQFLYSFSFHFDVINMFACQYAAKLFKFNSVENFAGGTKI